jgi:hypothetical protein
MIRRSSRIRRVVHDWGPLAMLLVLLAVVLAHIDAVRLP